VHIAVRECFQSFGAESLVFPVLTKNLKMKIYGTITLPVVLYGCETWSLTLREERRLRVYENRMLRRVCGPKRKEVRGSRENYIMRSLMICVLHQIFFG
jgi:hypothetical protein